MRCIPLLSALAVLLCAVVVPSTDAQNVVWSIEAEMNQSTKDITTSVAFIDEDYIVLIHGPIGQPSFELQLFSTSTQQKLWTLPNPCPFSDTTTTSWVTPATLHVRRTGSTSFAYLCADDVQADAHVVSVHASSPEIVGKAKVFIGYTYSLVDFVVIGSVASGAYCVGLSSHVLCVSATGDQWKFGESSAFGYSPSFNEYNGTLVVRGVAKASLDAYDLRTGQLMKSFTVNREASPGVVAGDRYYVILNTEVSPCTAITLDMQQLTMSAIVTLPNSSMHEDTGNAVSTVALMVNMDSTPQLIVTIPTSDWESLTGWQVPATTETAVEATVLFTTAVSVNGVSGTDGFLSWAVSPGFVVVTGTTYPTQYPTSTSDPSPYAGASTNVIRVADGKLIDSFNAMGAPAALTSVAEKNGYFLVAGTYTQTSTTESSGAGVTLYNSTTGLPLWSKGSTEVIGPDLMPLDVTNNCVIVAPAQGYLKGPWGSVQCLSL